MTDLPLDMGPMPRADLGVRFVASLIDGAIVGVINVVLYVLLGFGGRALGLAFFIGYFTYFEGSPAGQTIGKRAMKIRVVSYSSGQSIDYSKSVVRALMRYVSSFAFGLGFLWVLWDKRKQTWHDKVAGTVVVPVAAYPIGQ